MSAEPAAANDWVTVVDGQPLRYFDRRFNVDAIKLLPGEFAGEADNTMLVTILGSCVAACLWDEQAGVGGMNHFMLPGDGGVQTGSGRYGVHAMEQLINRLLSLGAERARLRAKLFGGAAVVRSMTQSDVGESNISFVGNYLKTERIPVVASDLAGPWPRRVHFFAGCGRAFVKRLPVIEAPRIVNDENLHFQRLKACVPDAGSVELF
ncbi:chemoreceptor glutamine deamidase CheD [uncultured Abyssibacter sp.]|uniref:chemoreceptor glutamine deamidase CheD n=1 Tax=uncultured Abyssibacter sp. TaxID=2320202 RepID=UPI0032B2F24B